MGHENHPVSSPAHRRNQSPRSPSGSIFRKSSTFSREEIDLSWMALIRRHRFLLTMLVLLMFLCTIYLYFAIKLGGGDCSGLVGKEETLCQLKKSKAKASHVRKASRKLLSIHESAADLQNHHEVGKNKSVLIWGCVGDDMVDFLKAHWGVSALALDCQVLTEGKNEVNYQKIGSRYSSKEFGSIPCSNCSLLQLQLMDDQSLLWDMEYLLRTEGYSFWIFDKSIEFGLVFPNLRLHRSNGLKLL